MIDSLSLEKSFAVDVFTGLSNSPKFLSSKYFYDKKGDKLFQDIMNMQEYYLTRCEYEILNDNKAELLSFFDHERFHLIEFGAGDGYKTKVLLEYFLSQHASFKYLPVDISGNVLNLLIKALKNQFPDLEAEAINDEYFDALHTLNTKDSTKKIILFLGSNVGNFKEEEAIGFLKQVSLNISNKDYILIGFDLQKDPKVILEAYNDKQGITRAFNLNLLTRINNELGANFQVAAFEHYPIYDPSLGQARSYLISKKEQEVKIDALNTSFHFDAWEPVHTEISQKYTLHNINEIAAKSGFKVEHNFFDAKRYFVNSLWSLK